ncbi:MAG: hypothetical protein IJQ84_08505 [Paludibacteraceae bacterium]|nr:hypothetical protein [Paludibacteraceae bacterium]
MKKNYKQPCVEAAQLQLNSMVLAGSPAAGISGGGNTGGIGGGTDPIPGD